MILTGIKQLVTNFALGGHSMGHAGSGVLSVTE